jgi:hypothetical protein
VNAHGQGKDEVAQQHEGNRFNDEINGPWLVAPSDQVEVPGMAFVPIGL